MSFCSMDISGLSDVAYPVTIVSRYGKDQSSFQFRVSQFAIFAVYSNITFKAFVYFPRTAEQQQQQNIIILVASYASRSIACKHCHFFQYENRANIVISVMEEWYVMQRIDLRQRLTKQTEANEMPFFIHQQIFFFVCVLLLLSIMQFEIQI